MTPLEIVFLGVVLAAALGLITHGMMYLVHSFDIVGMLEGMFRWVVRLFVLAIAAGAIDAALSRPVPGLGFCTGLLLISTIAAVFSHTKSRSKPPAGF